MLRRWQFWLPVALILLGVLGYRMTIPPAIATGRTPSPRIVALITGGPGDYWTVAEAGAQAAADELGITLDIRRPKEAENVEQQMQILSAVSTSSDVEAVAISPIDADRQAQLITQVAGLKPLVTFDSDATASARHGYVGTSNFSAGLVAGTLVKTAIPEGGGIAVLMANETKENLIERLGGLRTRIAESPNPDESPTDSRYTVVGAFPDDGDNEKCDQIIRDLIAQHPDLACVVTLNARQGPVALSTLEALGKTGEVKLVAFDTPDATLDGVEQGKVFAAIAQDPFAYGYEAIGMLDALYRGDKQSLPVVGRASIHISVEKVTQDTVKAFRERLRTRSGNANQDS